MQIWQELDDPWGSARLFNHLGAVARCTGDGARAEVLYAQSLALHRALGDRIGVAAALNNLGIMAGMRSEYELAATYLAQGRALAEALGDLRTMSIYTLNLGSVAWHTGEHSLARRQFQAALQQAFAQGYRDLMATCLDSLGGLVAATDPEQAAHHWGAAEALRERNGVPLPASQRDDHEQRIARARATVQPHLFDAAWTAGRDARLADLIDRLNADQSADMGKNTL